MPVGKEATVPLVHVPNGSAGDHPLSSVMYIIYNFFSVSRQTNQPDRLTNQHRKTRKNRPLHKRKETKKYTFREGRLLVGRLKWHWMVRAWICANAGAVASVCMQVLFKDEKEVKKGKNIH